MQQFKKEFFYDLATSQGNHKKSLICFYYNQIPLTRGSSLKGKQTKFGK